MPTPLSPHFSVEEMERSPTAARFGLRNKMSAAHIEAAKALAQHALEPIRALAGPLRVNSGYRSPAVNAKVGGSPTSQHQRGEAADVESAGHSTRALFDLIRESGIEVDQVLLEFPSAKDPRAGWVHVSYREGKNRGQFMVVTKRAGRTVYTPVQRTVTSKVAPGSRAR